MEKDCNSNLEMAEKFKKEIKAGKRKRARKEMVSPSGSQQVVVTNSKSPVATYLITRILTANSLRRLSPTPNDFRAYLTPALDQVHHILGSNRLKELRQMVVCSSRSVVGWNKNKVHLALELGWIKSNETRSKKKPSEIEKPINEGLIVDEAKGVEKIYFIQGGNGARIIDEHLSSKGWTRTRDVKAGFVLKWVQSRSQIKYKEFREGEQMVNHIPSTWRLSNKIHLVGILKDLEDHHRPGLLKMSEVIPETYRLNVIAEQFHFKQVYREGEMWICKAATLNQGKGIYIIRKLKDFIQRSQFTQKLGGLWGTHLPLRVVQRYIKNPLLLNGRKADIRCFMLIASTSPFLILSHPGYVRLSCKEYDAESDEMGIHLTNQYVQKKDARYSCMKDDTIWSMDQLNAYVNHYVLSCRDLDSDWVLNGMNTQIRRLMLHCFLAAKSHLECRIGYFELLGFDFLIDDNLKVWLLEVNMNPSFSTECKVLNDLIPRILRETLDICVECFEKNKKRKPLIPLKSVKRFELLYYTEKNYSWPSRRRTPN